MDDNNNIIDQNGQISDIILSERGFNSSLKLGYLLNFSQKVRNINLFNTWISST